jgi:hypothetical protein
MNAIKIVHASNLSDIPENFKHVYVYRRDGSASISAGMSVAS